jgi:hypothetical protein
MMTRVAINNGNDPNAEGAYGDENLLHLLVDYNFRVPTFCGKRLGSVYPVEADLSAMVVYLLSVGATWSRKMDMDGLRFSKLALNDGTTCFASWWRGEPKLLLVTIWDTALCTCC